MGDMKYKVGDRVRIKTLDWYNENKDPKHGYVDCGNGIGFYKHMTEYCGKVMTISEIWDCCYDMEGHVSAWNDEMIEGLVEEETKYGTASNPVEPKSNANCLTRERVDALAIKIDKELPSGNQNVWELPDGYQFVDENGNVINATKIVLEKKRKEYPKTYEECCKIMQVARPTIWFDYDDVSSISEEGDEYECHIENTLCAFRKLLICRDAYWKIAGEEMGLGKPWKPDWNNGELKWCMSYSGNYIEFDQYKSKHHTLAFPTEEMRDTFYENFKELIESVKELL